MVAGEGSLGFSIVLPTRNRLGTLPRAVESVLVQDFPDFELIIVDDASTDATREYVERLDDPRIRYHLTSEAGGASRARNIGMDLARLPLIAFLDSDDEWRPSKLRRNWSLARSVVEPDFLAFNAIEVRTSAGSWREPRRAPRPAEPVGEFILNGGGFIQTSAVFGSRALLVSTRFDPNIRALEDWDLYLRATRTGAPLLFQPEVLTVHHADPRGDRLSMTISPRDANRWLTAHGSALSRESRAVFDLIRTAPALKAAGHGWRARATAVRSFSVKGVRRRLFYRSLAYVMVGPAPPWLARYTPERRAETT
jgi:glycosyltransferase involved in cell wall biosynthesis